MFGKSSVETSVEFICKELGQQREAGLARDIVFRKHIEHEEGILAEIRSNQNTCSESSHIKEQNGKLAVLTKETAELKGTVKIWCYIFAALISATLIGTLISNLSPKISPVCKHTSSAEVEPKDVLTALKEIRKDIITESNMADKLNKLWKSKN